MPDETTICKIRHLLEAHQIGEQPFARIGLYLAAHGLKVSRRTIVDATSIAAPRSTKNRQKKRDPEMHRTKLIHSVATTAAHGHDRQVLPKYCMGKSRGCGATRRIVGNVT